MSGLLFGTFVTAVIVLLLGYIVTLLPAAASFHSFEQILVSVFIALITLITRPLLFATVWSDRRDPFLLDQDVAAIMQGRAMGIIFGIIAAILIQNYVVS